MVLTDLQFCGAILLAFGAILQVDEHKGVKSFAHLSVGGFSIGIGVLGLALASWGIWALFKRKPSILTYVSPAACVYPANSSFSSTPSSC
jgi:hypothetical protein